MPDTFTQLYVHIVFAVKARKILIPDSHREDVQKYISGIITNRNCKPVSIYCNPDHIHILIGLHPDCSIANLVRDIKTDSAEYINKNRFVYGKFSWQNGYAAFSCSRSRLSSVADYIQNQKEHHKRVQFREEYENFLKAHGIENIAEYMRGTYFTDKPGDDE